MDLPLIADCVFRHEHCNDDCLAFAILSILSDRSGHHNFCAPLIAAEYSAGENPEAGIDSRIALAIDRYFGRKNQCIVTKFKLAVLFNDSEGRLFEGHRGLRRDEPRHNSKVSQNGGVKCQHYAYGINRFRDNHAFQVRHHYDAEWHRPSSYGKRNWRARRDVSTQVH